jgi:hypothetical protein
MESLYDQQAKILEEKLCLQRPLLHKLGNEASRDINVSVKGGENSSSVDTVSNRKQKVALEKFIVDKKFQIVDDDGEE